jgi:hypothetical protein
MTHFNRYHHASVGSLYPSFTVASVATCGIDFAAGLRRLFYCGESGAFAYRTFTLGRLCGYFAHFASLSAITSPGFGIGSFSFRVLACSGHLIVRSIQ